MHGTWRRDWRRQVEAQQKHEPAHLSHISPIHPLQDPRLAWTQKAQHQPAKTIMRLDAVLSWPHPPGLGTICERTPQILVR